MKEKIKNLSNKKIVIVSALIMIVVILLGLTYAVWSRNFEQTGTNINTYDCFNITYSETNSGVSQLNSYPQSDSDGLTNEPYEVTITNTCETPASYSVVLHKLEGSTLDNSHVKVAVDNIELLSAADEVTSTIGTEGRTIYEGIVLGKSSKTIQVRSWMEENTSESDGANKTFNYKITIEAIAGKGNKLASLIMLGNNISLPISNEAYLDGEPNQEKDVELL